MVPLHLTVRSNLCGLSKSVCVYRQIRLPFCFLKKMSSTQKPRNPSGIIPNQSSGAATSEKLYPSSYEEDFPSLSVNKGSSSKSGNFNKRRIGVIESGLKQRQETAKSKKVVGTNNSDCSGGDRSSTRIELGVEQSHETVNSCEIEGIVTNASLQEEHSHFGKNVRAGYVQKPPTGQSKSNSVVGTENSDCSEGDRSSTRIELGVEQSHEIVNSCEFEGIVNSASLQEEHSLPSHFGKKVRTGYVQKTPRGQSKSNSVVGTKNSDCSEDLRKVERFKICLPRSRGFETQEILRPGMVLLKRYISLCEQINIVKTCHMLGEGPGGFYRPGYKDGAKLSLYMMCLGLNWDPQTRKYDRLHPIDDCEPPDIPHEFCVLVQRAIQDAHFLIKKDSYMVNPEDILPLMSPNICIVNFYTKFGKLGLHQVCFY
ncbi:hypothetical protein PTKIN_Ptkin09bG0288700 [Pterospermum kingtungense]